MGQKYGTDHHNWRPLSERLWEKYIPDPATGCWIWAGDKRRSGYGVLRSGKGLKRVLAHRTAFELIHGPIPNGLLACHRCDVRACINPSHIFIGTQADNVRDMISKGRNPRGAGHVRAKLTVDQVAEIRASKESQRILAVKFGVSQTSISRVLCGRRYKENNECH